MGFGRPSTALPAVPEEKGLNHRQPLAPGVAPVQPFQRGYTMLYQRHVTQAHLGCDFDFLHQTEATVDPEIH